MSADLQARLDERNQLIAKMAAESAREKSAWREESARLHRALQFYADGSHFAISDDSAWDTVSGEPQNFWCDAGGTATVEDGSIARLVLGGGSFPPDEMEASDNRIDYREGTAK